jgi:hypothetical protein
MIRPWIGALSVVLGVAALPCSAMAQGAPDNAAPTITIATPQSNAQYHVGDPALAQFSCVDEDGGSGLKDCVGTVASGAQIDTATAGPKTFTVTAHDNAGNERIVNVAYTVTQADDGGVGGQTPPTLTLDLSNASPFTPFVPGIDRAYTTTATARVVSSALDATLSVADASTTDTGHLVNGTYALPQGLQIGAAKPAADGTTPPPATFAPIGGSSNPTLLLTYDGPVVETDTLTFKQNIGGGDALRTGAYSKTLTFTLSTMNP